MTKYILINLHDYSILFPLSNLSVRNVSSRELQKNFLLQIQEEQSPGDALTL